MDVGGWLQNLITSLATYEAVFRDNTIDREVLPELADGDVKDLGIPLGHRKRLSAPGRRHSPSTNRAAGRAPHRRAQTARNGLPGQMPSAR